MSTLKIAMLGLVTALASTSFAQPKTKPKHTRPQDVKVEVKLSDRVKPTAAKGKGESKPTMTAEDALAIEGLKGEFQAEQEQILLKLIKDTPDSEVEEKADYMFRLGELYAKQHRFWKLSALQQQIAVDAKKGTPAQAQAQEAGKKAKHFLVEAVRTYKTLTDNEGLRN